MKGKISSINRKGVLIHTYTSPEDGAFVNSHIIETKNRLVIIDTQFLRPYAKEVVDYVAGIGKIIERIIITHSHPDHWFGLEYFEKIPVYSLSETKNEIDILGDDMIKIYHSIFKDSITDKKILPGKEINEGEIIIDGLKYELEKIKAAEAGVQLLIKFPELGIIGAQDITINKVHLFIGQNAIDGWIKVLNTLKEKKGYNIILVGHGENSDMKVLDNDIEYLKDARKILASVKNGKELKEQLIKKYPDYRADFLIDVSSSYLFK